jgi:hypothetical protein
MSDIRPSDGWRQREQEQLQAWLKLSYRQRLDWLWQAKLFAERARLSAEARGRRELGVEGEKAEAGRKETSET